MDKSKQLDFSNPDIYVGLDTHLKSWRVSIIVGETVYITFSQHPDTELIEAF